jgi:hypothetical protein
MGILKPVRLLGTTAVLVAIPLFSTVAQTQSPMSRSTGTPPAATRPEVGLPPGQLQTQPTPPIDRSTTAVSKFNLLIGTLVFSSDGIKLGTVRNVETGADGTMTAIHFKTGGFLGFGGKVVAIPVGKFTPSAAKIDVLMTADEVSKLPALEDQG